MSNTPILIQKGYKHLELFASRRLYVLKLMEFSVIKSLHLCEVVKNIYKINITIFGNIDLDPL
jgi:hypothetical protein